MAMDRPRAARAIEEFLRALGYEPEGDLAQTGERVADAWIDDLVAGEKQDAAAILREGSIEISEGSGSMVVLRGLDITTMCPHHLLPAHGRATVAYRPAARVAGLGTIAQIVDAFSRRLTLQEQIGEHLVAALVNLLGAHGALCRLQLTHTCLVTRGEKKAGATVETLAFAGTFAEAGADRNLALAVLQQGDR
jgi:GTP cyclohydrolase IA